MNFQDGSAVLVSYHSNDILKKNDVIYLGKYKTMSISVLLQELIGCKQYIYENTMTRI